MVMSKKTNTINQIPSQQRSLDFGTYETGNYEDCGQHCMTVTFRSHQKGKENRILYDNGLQECNESY